MLSSSKNDVGVGGGGVWGNDSEKRETMGVDFSGEGIELPYLKN